jgi:hypothetical protein
MYFHINFRFKKSISNNNKNKSLLGFQLGTYWPLDYLTEIGQLNIRCFKLWTWYISSNLSVNFSQQCFVIFSVRGLVSITYSFKFPVSLFSLSLLLSTQIIFGSVKDWTQDLMHTEQTQASTLPLSHIPNSEAHEFWKFKLVITFFKKEN